MNRHLGKLTISTAICLFLFSHTTYSQTNQPAQFRLDDYTRMVQDLQQQINIEPKKAVLHKKLADVHMQAQKRDEAIESYRQSIALAPQYQKMTYRVQLAIALAQNAQYQESRKELTEFLSDTKAWINARRSTKGQVLFYLGFTNFYLDQLSESENFFKLQIEFLKTRSPLTLNYLGLITTRLKRYVEAERYFKEAIERAKPSLRPLVQFNYATLLIQQKKWDEAMAILQEVQKSKDVWKRQPARTRALLVFYTAVAAYKLNQKDLSQPLFEEVIKSPALPEALRKQANIYLGRVKPQVTKAEEEVEIDPWSFLVRFASSYDTNVQFLPGVGPLSLISSTNKDSMAYSILFSPTFATSINENLLFDVSYFLTYLFQQDRDFKINDLLSNTAVFVLRRPFEKQRLDFGFRADLPFFNTDGLELFYQKYGVFSAWYLFWNKWWATKMHAKFDLIEYRKDSIIRANNLDGVIYTIGSENTFLLFDPTWRLRLAYTFSYENKEGDNFEGRFHKAAHSINSPRFGPFQFYYRGVIKYGQYPKFIARPRRKEQTYEFFWNLNTFLSPSYGLNSSIYWTFNRSKKQLDFDYNKVVYEGSFYFLF